MRRIPPALQALLQEGATTLAHGWRLSRRDGVVLGFTDHDRDLVLAGLRFHAASGIAGSESAQELGLAVSGAELSGALSAEILSEADLSAGRFDGAMIDHLLIDWTSPETHLLLRRAQLGEVRREGGAFTVELRALSDALGQTRGRLFGALCDADLGDARCGVSLADHAATGTVTAVAGALQIAIAGLGDAPDGSFTQGRLAFTSGANAGLAVEVKRHARADSGGILDLWQRPPEAVAAGDGVRLTAGCDKRFSTCRDRFANALNFRGCPHMPGNDFVMAIAVPGEGGHDGSVLA
ncbi:MAG: beta tubulin [Rhizobiales bacterium 32-66-8]|nr:MAG: beta tubulin [Rhizobiales bacterium 32-66-8]